MSNLLIDAATRLDELQAKLENAPLAVVYLGAKWARINALTREFITMEAAKFPTVRFVVLDERQCFDITNSFNVRVFPTTILLKDGSVASQVMGGDRATLHAAISQLSGVVASTSHAQTGAADSMQSSAQEDAVLQRVLEESRQLAESKDVGASVPEVVDDDKLAECLAAVRKVNAEEQAKREAAAKAAAAAAVAAEPASGVKADSIVTNNAAPTLREENTTAPVAAEQATDAAATDAAATDAATTDAATTDAAATDAAATDAAATDAAATDAAATGGDSEPTADDDKVEDLSPQADVLLAQLLSLDIPRDRALAVVRKSGATTVDAAMDWMETHPEASTSDGDDAQAPSAGKESAEPGSDAPRTAKSIRCTDTGKVFRTMVDAQLYAERTGHTNFEECDEAVPEKTEEEKKADRDALLARIKAKKAKKAEEEKEHARLAELERRRQGMIAAKQAEELRAAQRKREVEKLKREKAEKAAAKKKQLELWELDHLERASGTKAAAKLRGPKKLTIYEAEDKAKKSIASLKTYTGGVGLKCLKILLVYVSNALKDDPKFHRINLSNKAFQKRVKECIGHGGILIAAGFEKVTPGDEASPEGYWQLKEQDEKKIAAIVAILERAKRSPGFK